MIIQRLGLEPEEFEYLQEFVVSPGFKGLRKLVSAQIEWHKEKLCTTDLKDDRMLLIERAGLDGAKKIQKFIDSLKTELKTAESKGLSEP